MTHDMKFALKKCSGEKTAFLTQNSKLNIDIFLPSYFLQRQGIHCLMSPFYLGEFEKKWLTQSRARGVFVFDEKINNAYDEHTFA